MNGRIHVVVAVPARDEARLIGPCIASIRSAVRYARRRGLVDRAHIEVVAHRCRDETARRAARALGRRAGSVTVDHETPTIGAVRAGAVRLGLARIAAPPREIWVLSTDADGVVPPTWITSVVTVAAAGHGAAVVGLAHVKEWQGSEASRHTYRALVASRLHINDGQPFDEHEHVYGANLAVRADAYLDVGGFAHVAHGEDHALVRALEAGGHRVLRTSSIGVTTSGRFHGRAAGGLADLLRKLDAAQVDEPEAVEGEDVHPMDPCPGRPRD